MKATVVKLPSRYVILVGEGDERELLFANTGYQAMEVCRVRGASDIKMGDVECNLTLTHTSDLPRASSSGSSSRAAKKQRTG